MEVQALSPEVIQDTTSVKYQQVAADDIASTFYSDSLDLLSHPLGTRIIALSDEFFASTSNLLTPTPPIHKPNTFTHAGAWYDGWETRRHNREPFDYVVFGLAVRGGRVKGVEIDTGFFSGNQAPEIAVEGCCLPNDEGEGGAREKSDEMVKAPDFAGWETILPRQSCGPACRQAWVLPTAASSSTITPMVSSDEKTEATPRSSLPPSSRHYTHIRLLMYPDGGIGRFRLYGVPLPSFPTNSSRIIDLAATVNGGLATRASDQHFGRKDNLLLPGRGVDMGDGWETKRSRGGDHTDWVVVRLGCPGEVVRCVVDTAHFRGNFPQKVRLFGAQSLRRSASAKGRGNSGVGEGLKDMIAGIAKADIGEAVGSSARQGVATEGEEAADPQDEIEPAHDDPARWTEILAPTLCEADKEHVFEVGQEGVETKEGWLNAAAVKGKRFAWIKMVIIPDGGVKRLRVFGRRGAA
ncbi:MAG: Allantoicase [Alyxoria varia]|nr:MAG: Allantoicase [Alyxoria varia]